MKQRLISAFVGIILLVAVLFFLDTVLFNIIMIIVSAMAIYELLVATKFINNIAVSILSFTFAILFPMLNYLDFLEINIIPAVMTVFVILLFVMMIIYFNKLRIEQIAFVYLIATTVPFAFSSFVFIRDNNPDHALFLVFLTLGMAWIPDTGGYFAGRQFGKHKLAEHISPKKTVEGLIGSYVFNIIFVLVIGNIYTAAATDITINYLYLVPISVFCTTFAVLGDLSASIIKRQYLIKDFGNIMPGHGGVLDRFDSVLFVAPFMLMILRVLEVV